MKTSNELSKMFSNAVQCFSDWRSEVCIKLRESGNAFPIAPDEQNGYSNDIGFEVQDVTDNSIHYMLVDFIRHSKKHNSPEVHVVRQDTDVERCDKWVRLYDLRIEAVNAIMSNILWDNPGDYREVYKVLNDIKEFMRNSYIADSNRHHRLFDNETCDFQCIRGLLYDSGQDAVMVKYDDAVPNFINCAPLTYAYRLDFLLEIYAHMRNGSWA